MMKKRGRSVQSKKSFVVSIALIWATPMSIVFYALFWKLGALTIVTAFAIVCMSVAAGSGFAAVLYAFVKGKYGFAEDDN
jgi:hypothetical protein